MISYIDSMYGIFSCMFILSQAMYFTHSHTLDPEVEIGNKMKKSSCLYLLETQQYQSRHIKE